MPHRDPEARREYQRQYQQANRERRREYGREWRARPENRARELERKRRALADPENRERKNALARQRWQQEDPERRREKQRKYVSKNREKVNAARRTYRRANADKYRADLRVRGPMIRHGTDFPAVFAELWQAQEGACYLCGEALRQQDAVMEHDHRCCPPARSCLLCRRGLACDACNSIIGFAHDDPGKLRRIAANLETAMASVAERIGIEPAQQMLGFDGE